MHSSSTTMTELFFYCTSSILTRLSQLAFFILPYKLLSFVTCLTVSGNRPCILFLPLSTTILNLLTNTCDTFSVESNLKSSPELLTYQGYIFPMEFLPLRSNCFHIDGDIVLQLTLTDFLKLLKHLVSIEEKTLGQRLVLQF